MVESGLMAQAPVGPTQPPQVGYIGTVAMEGMSSINAREDAKAAAEEANNKPLIQGLAGHIKQFWEDAKSAKEYEVEDRMLRAMRARRGEYDPEVLSEIQKTGGSEIYMMLTSSKCRAAASWIRDVLLGTKDEKPWTISPTPLPDLPPVIAKSVAALATKEAQEYEQMTGLQVGQQDMERIVSYMKDRIVANARQRAAEMCKRMEDKMEDQLVEGGFQRAIAEFIEDIVTFPSAVIKGPVVRNKKKLQWIPAAGGEFELKVEDKLVLEWQRVDPFMLYPAAHSTDVDDGDLIERHKLSRQALVEMKGVEGYSNEAIDAVLDEYGAGGLNEWVSVDSSKAEVEGKSSAMVGQNSSGLIDALQFWGSVQGKMLIEWGMDEKTIPDPLKDYQIEGWLIGRWVIKAMLNPDPVGRKPYYKASYEEVPGTFWGNAVADLCRDTQTQCNQAARAIANNTGLASGPQATVNVDRLPPGEDITQMYPWKIWQTTSDPYGSSAQPVSFFQPQSIAGELMQLYMFWSNLADEQTGVPRYLTGEGAAGGAGRTASGMSMMMNNAGKSIKQVVANIDYPLQQLIERLYFYNMKFGTDMELKGDVNVIARGANSLVARENAQVRKNEFLQLALSNPLVNQIVGEESIAGLLRDNLKTLDVDADSIIPRPEQIRARIYQQQMQQQKMAAIQAAAQNAPSEEIEVERGPDGEMLGMKVKQNISQNPAIPMMGTFPGPGFGKPVPAGPMSAPGQELMNGAPQTDNFSPMRMN